MLKMYTDASADNLNNKYAAGILIIKDKEQIQLKQIIDAYDNHSAEFVAAIQGFKYLTQHFTNEELIFFYSDSKIVIDSLDKNYSKSYANFLTSLVELQDNFNLVMNQWITDKENSGAHNLAIQALHQKA